MAKAKLNKGVLSPSKTLNLKQLTRLRKNKYGSFDSKTLKEYSKSEVDRSFFKKQDRAANKFMKSSLFKSQEASFFSGKRKPKNMFLNKGNSTFFFGKNAYTEAKKGGQGTWVTIRGSRVFIQKKSNVIPF